MELLVDILRRLIQKFRNAFRGLKVGITEDKSIRVQFLLGFLAVIYFLILGISRNEWLWVAVAITLVISFEFINSCIEDICNLITAEQDIRIKNIKDMGSAFVLLSAFFALVVLCIISANHLL